MQLMIKQIIVMNINAVDDKQIIIKDINAVDDKHEYQCS